MRFVSTLFHLSTLKDGEKNGPPSGKIVLPVPQLVSVGTDAVPLAEVPFLGQSGCDARAAGVSLGNTPQSSRSGSAGSVTIISSSSLIEWMQIQLAESSAT